MSASLCVLLLLIAQLTAVSKGETVPQSPYCSEEVNEFLQAKGQCQIENDRADKIKDCEEPHMKKLEESLEKLTSSCRNNGSTNCSLQEIIHVCEIERKEKFFQRQTENDKRQKRANGIRYSSSSSSSDSKQGLNEWP